MHTFVIIGDGVLTYNFVRPPLQFMNKLDQGLIQRNTKDGSDSILGHSGIPSCEHWMFLGDAKPRNDEEVDAPDGGPEVAFTTTTKGGKEIYVTEPIYHVPLGGLIT